ncbi:putative inorganic phosphate transporter 1-5 [Quercus suber]|uniref:Inorganic phosphate transporter 1-5 n=1 Tax=Quercus suber TaxID=58331 RepID=A0AAW0KXQ9_QUESU
MMYSLTFFFANFGPNATTFVVPAEIFPARLRSTCHGISAASGNLGLWLVHLGFCIWLKARTRPKQMLVPCWNWSEEFTPCVGWNQLLGILFTFLVPESKGKSLEEMSRENEDENGGLELEQTSSFNSRTVPVY